MTTVKRGVVLLLLLAAAAALFAWMQFSDPASGSRIPPPAARPNVVLITIDTLRADRVGRGLTPAIDSLAAHGISYREVRATAPLTLPSHVSLMTGSLPPVHGVRENGVVFDRKRPTIAGTFRAAGYRTGAFVGAYVLNRRFGLDEGFETYDDGVRRDPARSERLEAERPGAEVVDAALAWLARQHSTSSLQPFFLWVHLYDPHAPYAPPQVYLAKAGGHAYDGEVAYADAQVGRILEALETRGQAGSTVIAITGDHGEALGEHGEATHGMLAYDATLRVPLVVGQPGASPGLVEDPLSLASLGPMLLHQAGIGPPSSAMPVYAESRYPRRAGWHALAALADERWKLIRSSEVELYEISTDRAEERNVAPAHPSVVAAMSAALESMAATTREDAGVAPEAAERLRALGYVSGASAVAADDRSAPNPARVIAAWTEFEGALGLLHAGNARGSAQVLKRLAGAHPGSAVFQSTYAQALRESGDPRGAAAVYRAAVGRWPNDPALFHDLAVAAREAGNAAEAIGAEQASLALDSRNAMAQNGLGLLLADAGRSNDAAARFEQAAQLDPGNPSYWTNLGNARRATEDPAAAERAYRQALEADGEFPDALNGLGTIAVQAGRAAEAVPLFERALRGDPDLHEARVNLGIALQANGQRARAAATFREVLATAPPSARREREAAAALLRGLR
jgi:arylsulfatase A-like enzyme/Flp pilus assembly protein TadD